MNKSIYILSILLLLTSNHGKAFAQSRIDQLLGSPHLYQDIVVQEVMSADTIQLETGEKIKLIGLKAPEPPEKEKTQRDEHGFVIKKVSSVIPIEEEAFNFVRDLLEGKHVRLEFDYQKRSPEGTFAYVFLINGNIFVNAEILRQGYADLQIQPSNTKYTEILRQAYQEARREKRGLQAE